MPNSLAVLKIAGDNTLVSQDLNKLPKSLVHLELEKDNYITEDNWYSIASELRTLILDNNTNLTEEIFKEARYTNLRHISTKYIWKESYEEYLYRWNNDIDFTDDESSSDDASDLEEA